MLTINFKDIFEEAEKEVKNNLFKKKEEKDDSGSEGKAEGDSKPKKEAGNDKVDTGEEESDARSEADEKNESVGDHRFKYNKHFDRWYHSDNGGVDWVQLPKNIKDESSAKKFVNSEKKEAVEGQEDTIEFVNTTGDKVQLYRSENNSPLRVSISLRNGKELTTIIKSADVRILRKWLQDNA